MCSLTAGAKRPMPFLNRVLLAALCVALFGCSKERAAEDKPVAAEATQATQSAAAPRSPVTKQHQVVKAEATPAKSLDRATIVAAAEPSTSPTVRVHGRVT